MAKTKTAKPKKKSAPEHNGVADEVLTLAEAAAWLKIDEQELEKLTQLGRVPAAKFGDKWRFLRNSLVRLMDRPPQPDFWQLHLGAFQDDPDLMPMLDEIYRRRRLNTLESS